MSSFQSNSSWPTAIAAATTCGGSPEEPAPCRYFVSEKRTEKSGKDNIGHWVGDHWGRIKTTGYCQVLPDCSAECGHDDPEITYGDSGISLTCHKGFDGHYQLPNRAKYSPANPPKCSQHANVTFWACTFCYCVEPPANLPWEHRQIWTMPYDPVYTCGET